MCVVDLGRARVQPQCLLGFVDVVLDVVDGGEVSQVVSLWKSVTFKQLLLHKMPENTPNTPRTKTHEVHTTTTCDWQRAGPGVQLSSGVIPT